MNDLIMDDLFPVNVFRVKKLEFVENTLRVFNEYTGKIQQEKGIFDIYPATMSQNMVGDERLAELSKTILEYAWQALNMQGYNMDMFFTYFTSLWGQEHQRTSSMDYHSHGQNSQISGFYFLEVPANSMRVLFHDPKPVKVYAGLPERRQENITSAASIVNYIPEAGDLILTNSWLAHSFTRNLSYAPVKFLHFNIGVGLKEQTNKLPENNSENLPPPPIVV